MLTEKLIQEFGYDTPIFTDEILALFPEYTRAYVFRLMKASEEKKQLVRVEMGVYYVPQSTPFGLSVIAASKIAKKKYVEDKDNIFGIYGGIALQNAFSLTTQVTNTIEIVTNREATRRRKVTIDGMDFILRKSRVEITENNAAAYRVLQLFTEKNGIELDKNGTERISEYIAKQKITQEMLLDLAKSFPARTLKNLIYSGVLSATYDNDKVLL